jgi:hypothetical protein
MIHRKEYLHTCVGLLFVAISGCAEAFLGAGGFLGQVGDGLNAVGTCLSPLAPTDLNAVFTKAPLAEWADGSAEITDASQPEVEAFLGEQLGQDVTPADYLVLRIYQLGPLAKGEAIQIEPLSDVIDHVWLYDADHMLIPAGSVHDFDGRRRTLQIPITRDTTSAYLRIDLEFLSERDEPIARLTRLGAVTPSSPRPQTVVLHFGGQDEVTFRNGLIVPAQIGAIDDPTIRYAAVEQFRAIYAPFDLTVLTDGDPLPEGPFSVVYIGPTDLPAFNYGLAEIVDSRNVYPDDVAVVDADQPALDLARLLGPETYGRALGAIAAHEMGHLLGLEHVSDPDALMTGAQCQGAGLDVERMLARQFKKAPLILVSADLQEWILGYQDPVSYLMVILGPSEATP